MKYTRNKMNHFKKTLVCLILLMLIVQSMLGQTIIAMAAESPLTGNVLILQMNIEYSGAANLKPEANVIKDNIKFTIKEDGNIVENQYISIEKESDSLCKISVENYNPNKNYTADAALSYDNQQCSYVCASDGMSTPTSTYDAAVFDAIQKITVKPVVSESTDKTFEIIWWDENNADKKRPSKEEFENVLNGCIEYSLDGNTWQKYNPDSDITLEFSSQIKENETIWTFECKGLAKKMIDGDAGEKEVQYRLALPSVDKYLITEGNNENSYKYKYCADLTGTIIWNNSSVNDKPDTDDINLTVYQVEEDGSYTEIEKQLYEKNCVIDKNESNWTFTISNLPSYDDDADRIIYVVKETTKNEDGTINGFDYTIEYDNKSGSTADDVCYSNGYIINTVRKQIDLDFSVKWIEPSTKDIIRPEVVYSLWRYSEGKKIQGSEDLYDCSTASMVTYMDGDTRKTVSEVHDWSESDPWKKDQDQFEISFKSTEQIPFPQYDEEGYKYIYFLKQTDEYMSTDIDSYEEDYTYPDWDENKTDEVIYRGQTVTNIYQESMKVYLSKTWKNVKNILDYADVHVELVLTRTVNGVEDSEYRDSVTLGAFSPKFNTKTGYVMAERYDKNGNEYSYNVKEIIYNKDNEIIYDGLTPFYDINNHSYAYDVTETDGTELNKDGKTISTRTYKVTNTETETYKVKIVKQWGSGYNDVSFDELPDITVYLKQNDAPYSTISFEKREENGESRVFATIEFNNRQSVEREVILSTDKKRWELNDDVLNVPVFDDNNREYSYEVSESGLTAPVGKNAYYTVSYSNETVSGKDIITAALTNNISGEEEHAYKRVWIYKKWADEGDTSKRSPVAVHLVILGEDGKIVYDLADSSDCENFINALNTVASDIKEKAETELQASSRDIKISADSTWKREVLIPKALDEYAQKIDINYYFSFVEAGMYPVGGNASDNPIIRADYKDYNYSLNNSNFVNNNRQQYSHTVAISDNKNQFIISNTRQNKMDVKVNFKWNDFDNKAKARPDKVKIILKRYVGDNDKNIDHTFNFEKTVTIDQDNNETVCGDYNSNVEEYAPDGKSYHYLAELVYYDSEGSITDLFHYDEIFTSKYESGSFNEADLTVSNSSLTFDYGYTLNDNVKEHNAVFYKIWRDVAKKNSRPDLTLKIFQNINDTNDRMDAEDTVEYYRGASYRCEIINGFAQKYTFYNLPEYKILRDAQGKATGVEVYSYYAKEVLNTSDAGTYHTYVYGPDFSAMDESAISGFTFTSYDDMSDEEWEKYVAAPYAADYDYTTTAEYENAEDKGIFDYAPEKGCFVNVIRENLVYTGLKSWINMPEGVTDEEYPYVEVYFFRNKTDAEIENYKSGGKEVLKANAVAWTGLDASKSKFAKEIILPKYDEDGAASYNYTVIEGIYKDETSLHFLPDFIMSKSNGSGTSIHLVNKFDPYSRNQRTISVSKTWEGVDGNKKAPTAKFEIYRSENNVDNVEWFNEVDKVKVSTLYLTAQKNSDDTWTAEEEINALPIYSAQGKEYFYYAVEITEYAPSYGIKECVQPESSDIVKAAILKNSSADNSENHQYVKLGSVAQFSDGAPVDPGEGGVKESRAAFKNEKKTDRTILTGTVKWNDNNDGFSTRPEDKLVYLKIDSQAVSQGDEDYNSNNNVIQTLTDGQGSWLTKGTDEGFSTSDTSDAVYKVKDKNIYIRWIKNSDNTWTYTVTGKDGEAVLDVYAENGTQWKYTVSETKTVGEESEYFGDNYAGHGVTKQGTLSKDSITGQYTYTMQDIENTLSAKVTIQKQWSDTRNQYHFRPVNANIYFQYKLKTATEWTDYSEIELKGEKWNHVIGTLPTKTNDGKEYEFRAVENSITVNYTQDDEIKTKKTAVKYYNASDELISAESVKNVSTLSNKTEEIKGTTYYIGKVGSYSAKVPASISPNSAASVFIYNNLEEDDVVSLPITKNWENDQTFKNITRPQSVHVKIQKTVISLDESVNEDKLKDATWEDVLLTDGKSPLVVSMTAKENQTADADVWAKTYPQLPKYDVLTGNICYYRAVECDSTGTESSIVGSYSVDVEYTYDEEDTEHPYATEITNTYVPGMKLTLNKKWSDDSNRDGKRSDTVKINVLYKHFDTNTWKTFKTITLGKGKDGNYTWEETLESLPRFYISQNNHEEKPMEYKVSEESIALYTASYSKPGGTGSSDSPVISCEKTGNILEEKLIVTNTYTPQKAGLTIIKNWSDSSNKDGIRPESIDILLYRTYSTPVDADNTKENYEYYYNSTWNNATSKDVIQNIQLVSTSDWKLQFNDLPLKKNIGGDQNNPGNSYEYTYHLEEITALNRYKTADTSVSTKLTSGQTKTITLTNTLKTVNVNADFTWDDLQNSIGTRKENVLVLQRKAEGAASWEDVESKDVSFDTTANTKKKYSYGTLPMYSGSDVKYQYKIILKRKGVAEDSGIVVSTVNSKVQKGAYQITSSQLDSSGTEADGAITYNYDVQAYLPVINITGKITWEDQDNFFSVRPAAENYQITLNQKLTTADAGFPMTSKCKAATDDANTYTYLFENVRKYDDSGNAIKYTASELINDNYTAESAEKTDRVKGGSGAVYEVEDHTASSDGKTFTMTPISNVLNTYEIKLEKILHGGDSSIAFAFDLYVRRNGNWVKYNAASYRLRTGETKTVANLLAGCQYRIEELNSQNFTVSAEAKETGTQNPVTLGKDTSISNANATAVASSNTTVVFKNEGSALANIEVTKKWEGENTYISISGRPEKIYFILQRTVKGGANEGTWETVTQSSGPRAWSISEDTANSHTATEWKYKINGLQAYSYDENGEYIYRAVETDLNGTPVSENRVSNYGVSYSYSENQYSNNNSENCVITNTYITAPLTIAVDWADSNDSDKLRPDKVECALSYFDAVSDEWKTCVPSFDISADDWNYKFSSLPVYDENKNLIKYKVIQEEVEEYKTAYGPEEIELSATGKNELKITNRHGDFIPVSNGTDNSIAIENITPNPADAQKTNAGGKVEVLEQIDLEDFNVDDIPEPTESDSTDYKNEKLGVIWKPDEYWDADENIIINYTDQNGVRKQLKINIKELKDGKLPEQAKEDFPDMALYEKDGKYALILSDSPENMQKSVKVEILFKPTYGIINLTENNDGGTVKNAHGRSNKYSDGIPELDGNGNYTDGKFIAAAKKGYFIDLDNIYVSPMGEYDKLENKKYRLKVHNNRFSGTVLTAIDGEEKEITVTGSLIIKKNSSGEVVDLTIITDTRCPLTFGVTFAKSDNYLAQNDAENDSENSSENNAGNAGAVATGDTANLGIWLYIMLSSTGGMVYITRRKKYKTAGRGNDKKH